MKIANCRSGINPAAGDQSGDEWRIQNWYDGNWNVVLRHPKAEVRSLMSDYARHAADNNNCGYSQANRLSFWNALKSVTDYDPKNITIACDADCSSSTAAIIKAVGYKLGLPLLKNVNEGATTFTMQSALVAAGFQALTPSSSNLVYGDVCLNTTEHVTICVADSDISGSSTSTGGTSAATTTAAAATSAAVQIIVPTMPTKLPLLKQSTVGRSTTARDDVKALQTLLNLHGAKLIVDGIFGSGTLAAVKEFQDDKALLADGECGSDTWAALIG